METSVINSQIYPSFLHSKPNLEIIYSFSGSYYLQLLLDHGADINHMTSDNTTLLHHAAIEGHVPMAAKLLELGVEVFTSIIYNRQFKIFIFEIATKI